MRRFVALAVALVASLGQMGAAHAFCRRTTPIWSDANPVRVVIHPDMHNHIRHTYVNPLTAQPDNNRACTTSSQCGTDGLCVSGFPTGSFCRGPRWTRSELERAVLWVVGRINNETPADIPFVWVDLNNTHTCQIDEDCGDPDRPWMNCFQSNTITIMPSECDDTSVVSAWYTGVQWVDTNSVDHRAQIIRMGWSGTPLGQPWEHTAGQVGRNFPEELLHEFGHALGMGHVLNDFPSWAPNCVPNTPSGGTSPLCTAAMVGTCPVMFGDGGEGLGLNQHFYGFDDVEGLVALYGLDSAPDTRLFEDCDISAPSFIERSTTDLPLITDAATAPNYPLSGAGLLAVGGRLRDPMFQSRFQVFEWSYSSLGSALVATFDTPGVRSTGPIGIAVSPTHRAVSAHPSRLTGDARQWRRTIQLSRIPLSGGTQANDNFSPAVNDLLPGGLRADSAVPGVSSAYHQPIDAWVHAWRDINGQIVLVAFRGASWSNVVQTGIRSFATPSIACTPTTCMLVYVEVPTRLGATSTQTRLQWTEGTLSWPGGGTFNFSSGGVVTTSLYNVVSDPVVAAVRNPTVAGSWYYYVSTSWPQINGTAWGTRPLLYRRLQGSTGTNALLQMTPLLPHSPGISVQPTAGATGSCAELFTWGSP